MPWTSLPGLTYRPLTSAEEIQADFDRRWLGVFPEILKMINAFLYRHRGDERIARSMDTEDCFQDIYLELRAKDAKWTHERGRYITFATAITWRAMADKKGDCPKEGSLIDGLDLASDEDDPAVQCGEAQESHDLLNALLGGIARLSPIEAYIISAKHGIFGREPKSYTEIATILGYSTARTTRIADQAKRTLREAIRKQGVGL